MFQPLPIILGIIVKNDSAANPCVINDYYIHIPTMPCRDAYHGFIILICIVYSFFFQRASRLDCFHDVQVLRLGSSRILFSHSQFSLFRPVLTVAPCYLFHINFVVGEPYLSRPLPINFPNEIWKIALYYTKYKLSKLKVWWDNYSYVILTIFKLHFFMQYFNLFKKK